MSLHQLVLVSCASAPFDAEALCALGKDLFQRNSAAGVSGMLMHHEGNFIQLLEGDAEALDEILTRLQRDTQHRGVQAVLSSAIDERCFDGWYADVIESSLLPGDIRSTMEQIVGPSVGLEDDLLMAGRAHRVLHGCRQDVIAQSLKSATPPSNTQ
ncbi:MAG: hypothetical protein ACI8QS_003511 [Planctomycetota bacterium]|jgi:hypothetical protein